MTNILGIIAASGVLPIMVADNHASKSKSKTIVACIESLASKKNFTRHIAEEFPIGKVSAIIKYFKYHQVTKIVICGAMQRPDFSLLSVDTKGALLLTKILSAKFLGDDSLLKIVANYIEQQGFEIVAPISYTNQIPIKTKIQPTKKELDDIQLGLEAAKIIGQLDIGQSVIVEHGVVLGVEASEGTDALIKRCAALRKSAKKSGVLVKILKPTQDPRLDTPVIGVNTIRAVHEAGMVGIAVSGVIVLEPVMVEQEANKLGVFCISC